MSAHYVTMSVNATSDVSPVCPQSGGRWTVKVGEARVLPIIDLYITGTPDELEDLARRLLDVAEVLQIQAVSE